MKIVVPIMPTSLEEAQELELSRFEGADIIEWRADFLDKDSILTVAPAIFEKFAGFEIVFTIRTTREGGKLELTDAEYIALIKDVAAIYSPDYIDFEYFTRKLLLRMSSSVSRCSETFPVRMLLHHRHLLLYQEQRLHCLPAGTV